MVLAYPKRQDNRMKDAELRFYDKLMELPLFQGVGREDLALIAGHARIGFGKVCAGDTIVKKGDSCKHLLFMTSGMAQVRTVAYDNAYLIDEYVTAPYIIQPEHLFGLSQCYTKTFTASTTCNIMSLAKEEIMKLTNEIFVCRINLLNIYTTLIQKKDNALWQKHPETLEKRISQWILARCLRPAGEKRIKITMETLAKQLNDSRLDISVALNNMQREGLLKLSRGMIHIPQAEKI